MLRDRYASRVVIFFVSACGIAGMAQQPRQYTKEDYAKAEKFMAYNADPLAYAGQVRPKWLDDGRFWYRDVKPDGWDYVIVDPANKTKLPAFDQAKLAAALSAASSDLKNDARHLAITDLAFPKDHPEHPAELLVSEKTRQFRCDLTGAGTCSAVSQPAEQAKPEQSKPDDAPKPPLPLSPDKTKVAFIRDFNLWIREVASGKETQLTTDGVKDYGYATDNAGWKQSDRPILAWSPDSKKIATFRQDQRKTGEMYLVPVTNSHPELKAWKYPLVGDPDVTMIERVIIEVDGPKVIRLENAARPAPVHAVRRRGLQRDGLGRCAMEPGRRRSRVRLNLAGSQAGVAARGRGRDGQRARGDGRDGS